MIRDEIKKIQELHEQIRAADKRTWGADMTLMCPNPNSRPIKPAFASPSSFVQGYTHRTNTQFAVNLHLLCALINNVGLNIGNLIIIYVPLTLFFSCFNFVWVFLKPNLIDDSSYFTPLIRDIKFN